MSSAVFRGEDLMKVRKDTLTQWLFYIAIIAALLTQFPYINKGLMSAFNDSIWILTTGFIVINNARKLEVSNYLWGMGIIMVLSYVAENILISMGVISLAMEYINLIRIPFMVYFCSYYIGTTEETNLSVGKKMMLFFCALAFVMSVQVAMQFITNFGAWQSTEMYLYDGATHKNSSAQTLGNCILVLFVYWNPQKLIYKIARYVGVITAVAGLLYIQSRAALVAIGIALIISALFRGEKKKILYALLFIIIAVVVVLNSEFLMSLVRQAFFIDKYSTGGELDLNRFSSGRLDYWAVVWDKFIDSPFIGNGYTYCDNFYINVMAGGGLFIGGPYLLLYLVRVYKNISYYVRSYRVGTMDYFAQFAAVVSIFYMIISFFEGFPPYGPGVSCMMFWLISGYLDGRNSTEINYMSEEEQANL